MSNIFVLDIGNTNIVAGVYEKDLLKCTIRISSDLNKTADEYFVLIDCICKKYEIDLNKICKVMISSVVPSLTRCFEHLTQRFLNCPISVINGLSPLGLTYEVENPSYIGADLIVNAYSAWKKYNESCIICDMGTATTIQLVDANGHFHGTSILPGVVTGANHLFEKTALLSNIQIEKPQVLLGTNTKDALLSGIVYGHAFLIDRFITEIKSKYKHLGNIKSIATGGISSLISEQCHHIDVIDKTLTLDGLYKISLII